MATKVVFRQFKDNGDVIALFPEIPATLNPDTMLSYMHVGQHGAATDVIGITKPAAVDDYAALERELKSVGYDDLLVVYRVPQNAATTRRTVINKLLNSSGRSL